ncbi:MAG: hypothetical protein RR396_07350 [Clostridiales bacterium]
MPLGITKLGSMGRVSYSDDVVNYQNRDDLKQPSAMELAMAEAKNKSSANSIRQNAKNDTKGQKSIGSASLMKELGEKYRGA